ncbi:TonB-dependent receptor [Novosphingobium flavum]|uniref:TonB-dependent receptor n=1 Tax=Novosphingobium flavum TaxID=1778672 RepID=A0A7X1FTH9_9SPHN|nr:TonB-dependent receptor [Novosphingobium flavum]MBC2666695.1 TonB-dependent receptor [Novosphingobium flavum]
MKAILHNTSILALGLALFPGAPAMAQTAPDGASAGNGAALEEIVVTAEKREASAQKTAIAIDVLGGDKLAINGVNDIQQLQNVAPGVQFGQANTSTFVAVRGVSSRDGTEIGDPAVAINVDGVFLQRPSGMNAAFFDLDRIEVLRGPQGTLYGRNATGGVVNIISKKPKLGEFGGYAALTLGNYKTINGEGAINLPLGETVALRASIISRNHDGYRNNASSLFPANGKLRGDDEDTNGARLQLLFKPNDQFSALISGTYIKQGGVGPALVGFSPTAHPLPPTTSAEAKNFGLSEAGSFRTLRKNLSAQLDYDFGPVKATYLFGFVGLDVDHKFDNDGSDTSYYVFKRGEYSEDLSHELRFSSTGSGPFQWQFGGFFYDQTLNLSSLNYVNPIGVPFILRDFEYQVKSKSRAGFGQVNYSLTDAFKVSAGVRYSHDTKSRTGYALRGPGLGGANSLTAQPALITAADDPTKTRSDDTDWSYHFGVDYQVSSRSLIYAKVDKGYKSGGFTTLNEYGPEHVIAYEIGSKNRFLGNSLQINVSAFHYDYTDQQVQQFTNQGALTLNAGKSRVNGVEAQVDWKATPTDAIDLSVNWLDAKYKDFKVNVSNQNVPQDGHRLIQAPEWSISGGYEHTINLANGGKITPRAQAIYRSEQFFTFFNSAADRQGAYATLDLSVTYVSPDKKWSVQAYGRNVTNKVVLTSAVPSATTFQGLNMYQFAAPATFGVRVQANF